MLACCIHLLFLGAIGTPIEDIQGEWELRKWDVRAPGEDSWRGMMYGGTRYPLWRVRGISVEEVHNEAVMKWVAWDPRDLRGGWAGGIRFIDYDGDDYLGSYSLKDGKLVLTLIGSGPVKGKPNTNGTKYLTITLERPKLRNTDPFSLKKYYGTEDPPK